VDFLKDEERPSKDEYYLGIAEAVCKRSPCIRRQFGAIIVKEDAIVSTGYNGPPRGVINCTEAGCLKDEMDLPHYRQYQFCTAVHAEENAVINAARHGARVLGGNLYLYGQEYETEDTFEGRPCDRCKRTLINAGIEELVTKNAEGTIVKKDVTDWISEDTKKYLEKLEEAEQSR